MSLLLPVVVQSLPQTVIDWLGKNSKVATDYIQSIGIIATLLLTYFQLRSADKSNRSLISLEITTSHREIWTHLFTNPQLKRVIDENPELDKKPITPLEELFVVMVANHMSAVFDAHKSGMHRIYEADMGEFFKLPIPNKVWQVIKKYQAKSFVNFMENLLRQ